MARKRSRKKSAAKPARRLRKKRARRALPPAVPPQEEGAAGATEASLVAYAHDIRTTLTGILALSELLATSAIGERERRWASGVKDSAEHLSALTT